jgi:hypothetical protein
LLALGADMCSAGVLEMIGHARYFASRSRKV